VVKLFFQAIIEQVLQVFLILGLTLMLKFIELSRDILSNSQSYQSGRIISVRNFYDGVYWHLGMSMAAIGLICDKTQVSSMRSHFLFLIGIFIATIFGCFSRGMLSRGSPEVMSMHDHDWLYGIYIPNILSLAVLIFTFIKIN
jgi:FtsH-binding integral membrane protein